MLDSVDEGEDDITHIIQAIFPSLCIKFTLNSLAEGTHKGNPLDRSIEGIPHHLLVLTVKDQ